MKYSVMVVDDEPGIRFAFSKALDKEGYEVCEAETGEQCLARIREKIPDVILLDMRLPDMSGLDVLKHFQKLESRPVVIMMTAFGDIELAVEAMQLGAENFRTKPFNVPEMKTCIQRALENRKNRSQLETFRNAEKRKYSLQCIIGESRAIRRVNDLVKKIARSPSTTVLIQGPSGTGKELVARAIHYNSDRADNPFLEVNCTAIPESLLESELFGHEKGSFTDAKKEHKGIFEQADGGTLFLDEIGDMPLAMQAKLLRVLQEKRFKRIGGNRDITVDVRVIASTNVNLDESVSKGNFREDLYYRLKVVPLSLPPLRERDRDAVLIARHYLNQFTREFKKPFKGMTRACEDAIASYGWPGNVRELKNVIERAVLLENGQWLEVRHLNLEGIPDYRIEDPREDETDGSNGDGETDDPNAAGAASEPREVLYVESLLLEDVEKALLEKALLENRWNRNLVAKIVGINRTTLYSKIKKYGLEKEPSA
jgi:DNA-binding NtrC family response regulator